MDESALLAHVERGDEAAFRTLYRRHTPRLFSVSLRLLANRADAEDCVQETWMRAVAGLAGFRRASAFSTWLTGIGLRCGLEILRRRGPFEWPRESTADVASARDPMADLPSPIPDPRSPIGDLRSTRPDPNQRLDLERALSELASGYRTVLVLHDIVGHTHAEIAALLDIDAGTAKSQLSRARRVLRERLGRDGRTRQP